MTVLLTREETERRREEFCERYGVSELDVIVAPFDFPAILKEDVSLEDVPDELRGHPCLWLPKDIRAMRPDESPHLYATRIYLTLETLGYFLSSNGNWVDVIYDKTGLDTIEDSREISEYISDREKKDAMMLSSPMLYDADQLLSETSSNLYRNLGVLRQELEQKHFDAISETAFARKGLNEAEFTLNEVKQMAAQYHSKTNYEFIDSGLRQEITESINTFIYWYLAGVREKMFIEFFSDNTASPQDFTDVETTVKRQSLEETKSAKSRLEILEAEFYRTNGKKELVALVRELVSLAQKIA